MIKESLTPASKKMIQDLMECEEKLTKNSALINSDNLEYSVGYLYAKGLIKIKKQVVEGNVQVCTFLTDEGSRVLEKAD